MKDDDGNVIFNPLVTDFADVVEDEFDWIWRDRIPRGALTVIGGDPDSGKSFLSTFLAATLSRGEPWPDGKRCRPGGTLFVSSEDSLSKTMKKRLRIHGADFTRGKILHMKSLRSDDGQRRPFTLQDARELRTLLRGKCSGVDMVIVDPIGQFMGRADTHKDSSVRAVLEPIHELAEELDRAIVLIMHCKKGVEPKAIYKLMGSMGFVGIARAAWAVGVDPNDPERRLFLRVKGNLCEPVTGLSYRITDHGICWDKEPVNMSADDLFGKSTPGPVPEKRNEAELWLIEQLKNGRVASDELEQRAKADGLSWTGAVRKASEVMEIRKRRNPGIGSKTYWSLARPAQFAQLTQVDDERVEQVEHDEKPATECGRVRIPDDERTDCGGTRPIF